MAMRRSFDDEIIAAAVGSSRDGDGGAVVYNTAQALGDGSTAITFDVVTAVSEKFMANDIDPDEPKVFVISPFQARRLLQLTEATSGDYNALRPLTAKGYIESWMGYTWIVSTRLPDASTGQDGSEVYCFAMTRRAMGLQVNRDIWVRVAEDPTVSFAWRIYAAGTFGAIRVEDEHLVRVELRDVA
jgi:Phage capsid protein